MATRIPETQKIPGVHYAFTDGGLELAILDITHPVFRVESSDEDLNAQYGAWAEKQAKAGWAGRAFNRWVLPRMLRKSIIGRGLLGAKSGTLDGLSTYLMKLGARGLGKGYAREIDRRIADSIAGTLVRVRVQDLAHAQARALASPLSASPARPLHLVNIAGGPASDSLNTLLLLHRHPAAPLAARKVCIHLLDPASEGPHFAAASLAAWQADDGPLRGVDVAMEWQPYDWAQPAPLETKLRALGAEALVLATSEGGLFDYAADAIVLGNLRALRDATPADTQVCGTINPPEHIPGELRRGTVAAVHPRRLEELAALAEASGWRVAEHWDRPTTVGFRLAKA